MTPDRLVKLNVGGAVFHTSISTLCKHESMLKTMFTTDVPVSEDEDGCVFIDRDPRHFNVILNFLRDGRCALPDTAREVKELLAECSYFLLEPLVEQCENVLASNSDPLYHIATTVLESRKFIFGSEKPVIMLQLPVNIGTKSGTTNYYFSEQKFLELSELYHRTVTFVLVTESHFNEDSWWRFFLNGKTRSARIKGEVDSNLLEVCVREVLDDVVQRKLTRKWPVFY